MAHFLESRGMPENALEVATDPNYRFDLAVQLERLDIAKVFYGDHSTQISCLHFPLLLIFY